MTSWHRVRLPYLPTRSASRRTVLRHLGSAGLAAGMGVTARGHERALAQATPAAANTPVVVAWASAWNAHDSARLATLYTANGVHEDLAFDVLVRTPDEIRSWADGFFAASPDLTFELVSAFQSDDRAAAEWRYSGTDGGIFPERPASGKRYSVRGATIFTLREGQIDHGTDYYNLFTLQQQLGVVPETATPAP